MVGGFVSRDSLVSIWIVNVYANKSLHNQMEEWKRTCENLQSIVRQLHQEMEQALREKDKQISDLTSGYQI